MKTITVYELITLIKNKKAPKKIKINEDILNLEIGIQTLYKFEKGGGSLAFDYYIDNNKLDNEVKILDIEYLNNDLGNKLIKPFLEEEKKIPEKLKDILRVDDLIPPVDENMYKIWTQTIKNQNKINEICDYFKSKGE